VRAGHSIGFVFQEPTLMPWTSVRENVRLPLKLGHMSTGEANAHRRGVGAGRAC
jgi:NitT/TauT family transport system ATP-binding protein